MQDSQKITEWNPQEIFSYSHNDNYAVMILNRPIFLPHHIVLPIWEKAQITVTVDGGTGRWIEYLNRKSIDINEKTCTEYIPNLIVGDLDSASPENIENLRHKGSQIIRTPDQTETDYTKAIRQIRYYCKENKLNLSIIYVFVESTGRFDHVIGNINTLYKSEKLLENVKVIQVARDSLTWLLKSGIHNIAIPNILVQKQTWCGLLPFGSPVTDVTTNGLKWNLNHGYLGFGDLVSTSNTYDNSSNNLIVTIDTNTSLIWTMGLKPLIEKLKS